MSIIKTIKSMVLNHNPSEFKLSRESVKELLQEIQDKDKALSVEQTKVRLLTNVLKNLREDYATTQSKILVLESDLKEIRELERNYVLQVEAAGHSIERKLSRLQAENENLQRRLVAICES